MAESYLQLVAGYLWLAPFMKVAGPLVVDGNLSTIQEIHKEHEVVLDRLLLAVTGEDWSKPIAGKRVRFISKIKMSIDHGLVRPDMDGYFDRINTIRNLVAHQLNPIIEDSQLESLYNSVPYDLLAPMLSLISKVLQTPEEVKEKLIFEHFSMRTAENKARGLLTFPKLKAPQHQRYHGALIAFMAAQHHLIAAEEAANTTS